MKFINTTLTFIGAFMMIAYILGSLNILNFYVSITGPDNQIVTSENMTCVVKPQTNKN